MIELTWWTSLLALTACQRTAADTETKPEEKMPLRRYQNRSQLLGAGIKPQVVDKLQPV